MPKAVLTYFFQAPFEQVLDAHRRVFVEKAITLTSDESLAFQNGGIPCHVLHGLEQERLGFAWPAAVAIGLDIYGDQVRVVYQAENSGWGPIQQNHVNKLLESLHGTAALILSNILYNLTSRGVNVTVPPQEPQYAQSGFQIEQLKELASLKNQGLLSDQEFAAAKARIING
jgi:hypothetical protein